MVEKIVGRRPRADARWAATTSLLALFHLSCSAAALAQEVPDTSELPSEDADAELTDENVIIVTGNRVIIASPQDIPVEQSYDEDFIASYAVSTVGELLDEIRAENGDRELSILVNGRPMVDAGDIAGLPVEALARIEALPRGAAQQIGGTAGQRAYNIILKPSVRSATFTGSEEFATEGGWTGTKGEALFTYIKGLDRLNLTIRGADSGSLFEAERGLFSDIEGDLFSSPGNIIPTTGVEVDPALSSLAGQLVTMVALPQGNSHPTLADFIQGANQTNPSRQSSFRTLRGASRPIDLALSGSKNLADWLNLSFNGRLGWTRGESFNGLARARFLVQRDNDFTPLSSPVFIALEDPTRPLRSLSRGNSQGISSTLNSTIGDWRATLSARWDRQQRRSSSQFSFLSDDLELVGEQTNPFDGSLASLIPVSDRMTRSKRSFTQITAEADGPLMKLWAGPLRGRFGVGANWTDYIATDRNGRRSIGRHEYSVRAGLTLPLTSSREGLFLAALGDSELAADFGRVDLGRFGTLHTHSLALNWQVRDWLRFVASSQRDASPVTLELLAAPEFITPNVPYFDPLTGETVNVTTIVGGASDLKNESTRTQMISLNATPLRKYRMQLSVDFISTELRNRADALPPPSSIVVAAFPDRFVRDASETLVFVDNRFVNFAQRRTEQLRFGAGFTLPLIKPVITPTAGAGTAVRRSPPLNLQVQGSYTLFTRNRLLIRDGIPEIDLLGGGAAGIAAGQQRHTWNGSLALSRGGTGLRASIQNRGARIVSGKNPVTQTLKPERGAGQRLRDAVMEVACQRIAGPRERGFARKGQRRVAIESGAHFTRDEKA